MADTGPRLREKVGPGSNTIRGKDVLSLRRGELEPTGKKERLDEPWSCQERPRFPRAWSAGLFGTPRPELHHRRNPMAQEEAGHREVVIAKFRGEIYSSKRNFEGSAILLFRVIP